jgi:hypothetical protein
MLHVQFCGPRENVEIEGRLATPVKSTFHFMISWVRYKLTVCLSHFKVSYQTSTFSVHAHCLYLGWRSCPYIQFHKTLLSSLCHRIQGWHCPSNWISTDKGVLKQGVHSRPGRCVHEGNTCWRKYPFLTFKSAFCSSITNSVVCLC